MRIFLTMLSALAAVASCSEPGKVTSRGSSLQSENAEGGKEIKSTNENGETDATIFVPESSGIDSGNLIIQPGASVANQTTASYLTYPGDVQPGSNSVNIVLKNSEYNEQAGSLVVSLPNPSENSGAGLRLTGRSELAVFYHVNVKGNDQKIFGMIPSSKLIVTSAKVTFNLRGFGNYQVAVVSDAISQELTAKTNLPILTAAQTTSSSSTTTTTGTGSTSEGESSTTGDGGSGVTVGTTSGGVTGNGTVSTTTGGGASGTSGSSATGGSGSSTTGSTGNDGGPGSFSLTVGSEYSIAMRADDGALWCWGDLQTGQCGPGTDDLSRSLPFRMDIGANWKVIQAGGNHTCGIRNDDSLWCWGANTLLQLGVPAKDQTVSKVVEPVRLPPATLKWKSLALGRTTACAIDSDKALFCWGNVANSTFAGKDLVGSPVQIGNLTGWTSVTLGAEHYCAIRNQGELYCWGSNENGRSNPQGGYNKSPSQIGTDRWLTVKAGNAHTCGIRLSNRSLWCWGLNSDGQIGSGDTQTPVELKRVGTEQDEWSDVSLGTSHTCAIKKDQSLWCWGANLKYQLGSNFNSSSYIPAKVHGKVNWKSVAVGGTHSCATSTDNKVLCWGDNAQLQTGAETGGAVAVPTFVDLSDGGDSGHSGTGAGGED